MKNLLKIAGLISLIFWVIYSCRKEETILPPTVETASADNIYNTSARIGGRVSDDGGAEVTERGIYWDTLTNPEKTGTKAQMGTGKGTFFDTLKGLTSGTKYYVKAYAINKEGLSYGKETSFTTQISFPTVITSEASELTPTTAKIGGNVINDGGFEVTKRGVYWGTKANPQQTGIKIELGSGVGEFSQTITGLNKTLYYYVVAFATNIKGTSYGEEISFKTVPEIPTVTTVPALNISAYSAKVGGEIIANGGAEITEKGVYWGTSESPQTSGIKLMLGNGSAAFSDSIKNLIPGQKYYFIAYAVNSAGTAYGLEESFTTLGGTPEAVTLSATNFNANSITLNGLINANNLNTTVSFEYGETNSYGHEVNVTGTFAGSEDSISVDISGLTPMTIYHYRVIATNELGTVYGGDSTFKTVLTGVVDTLDDNDGNTYLTIGIGYQRWMAENLRTSKYNDGTDIPLANADTLWGIENMPAYCWYNKDSSTYAIPYGALYNWYAVSTGKLCPTGWHVPTDSNFIELINFLGREGNAGGALKEDGYSHWDSPNAGASNSYSFSAPGGGKRLDNGTFEFLKTEGNWWSSVPYGSTKYARSIQLMFDYENIFQLYLNKNYGISVRCVEDDEDE